MIHVGSGEGAGIPVPRKPGSGLGEGFAAGEAALRWQRPGKERCCPDPESELMASVGAQG